MLKDEDARFAYCYNRRSFCFAHELYLNPLFELPNLLALARRRSDEPEYAYWSHGTVTVADRWEQGCAERRSLAQTIAGIADNDSLVMLRHLERDPVAGPFVTGLMDRLMDRVGAQMRDDVIEGRATVLIASPRRITSYHIDADTNYLFQIAGDKLFSVFDHTDRTLTPDQELEDYFAGDLNGARPKEHRQNEAQQYALGPGLGVHVPSTAPHWARNGNSVSVALSLNFDLHSIERRRELYGFNRRLRRLGITPTPPGCSGWRDQLKLASSSSVRALGKALKPQHA